jgi:hypothetical protein
MQNLFLLTTLVKFEESHGTFDEEWKQNPIVANDSYLNRFEKSCGTFRGGGEEKTQCCQWHWVNFPIIYIYIYIYKTNNNYHGVDVNIVMVI